MTDHSDLIERLRAACVGYPRASIAWPHRILHEAASALSSLSLSLSEAREEIERLTELVKFWIDDSKAAHDAHAASERDLSSLRKGAEVMREAIEDAIEKLNTYRGAAVQTVIDQLEAALVSGSREDGDAKA